MPADGVVPPVLNLNRTPVGHDSSTDHTKMPWGLDEANLLAVCNQFEKMSASRIDGHVHRPISHVSNAAIVS
jgi:hypothetical protein